VQLVPVTGDAVEDLDGYVAIVNAADQVDAPPGRPLTRARASSDIRHGWDGRPTEVFLALAGDLVVGTVTAYLSDHENLDLAWLEPRIHPDHRRAGHGTRLLAAVEDHYRSVGRPVLVLDAWDSPRARAFAEQAGYAVKQVAVARDLVLDGSVAERARFAALCAEAERYGEAYDLVRIDGPTPDELVEGLVAVTEAINDAPNDDLEYDDEVHDADRIRAYEQAQLAAGGHFLRVLAVHRETGEVAGHTVVVVDGEQPAYAEQHDTTVLPRHRGRRLGLRLKADMLCWLADVEPGLRVIRTDNAETNGPMIAVNERLGYRVAGRRLVVQRRV
jgi:GNAT superfamily N-acetyltransferase